MKKFLLVILILLSFRSFSQVKFMGVSIDGNKTEVTNKLRQRGFKCNNNFGYLEGYVNNKKVILNIEDCYGKVFRIYYSEKSTRDKIKIINRFNTLLKQFEKDKNYIKISGDIIPEDENISYNMNVNNKIYEADFIQLPKENKNIVRICIERYNYGGDFYIKIYYENLLNKSK